MAQYRLVAGAVPGNETYGYLSSQPPLEPEDERMVLEQVIGADSRILTYDSIATGNDVTEIELRAEHLTHSSLTEIRNRMAYCLRARGHEVSIIDPIVQVQNTDTLFSQVEQQLAAS